MLLTTQEATRLKVEEQIRACKQIQVLYDNLEDTHGRVMLGPKIAEMRRRLHELLEIKREIDAKVALELGTRA